MFICSSPSFYFWLFSQTSCLEYFASILKNNVLLTIISCTPHLSPQRSSLGEIWPCIFSGFISVQCYIFTLFIPIIVNPERLIWRIFVIVLSFVHMSSLLFLSNWESNSVFAGTCCYLHLNDCPKVTLWIWVNMFQCVSPNTHFLLHFRRYPKLHFIDISISC